MEIIPPGLIPKKDYRTKQIEATTGWDDHNPQPPDMNMGVWQPVYLRVQGPISIRHPYVETDLHLPGLDQANLTVSAWLRNNTDAPVTGLLTGRIEDRSFSQPISLAPRETREVFFLPKEYPVLHMDHPRVWWPNPLGKQELYELHLSLSVGSTVSDTAATTFGIRDVDTYITPEDWRGYRVNGRNILIRGGAWMTIDMLLNLDPALYDALIRYAREANLNMLRSEGFSIRETAAFYNSCDRYGVMVTQQLFGRNIPDEALAIACIEDTLLRIRNHPSLTHFLGHDETFPTDTLDAAYRELLEKHRIRRTYQPHSGTFNIASRADTGGTRTGTRELWTYAGPSHYFFIEDRRFDTAWGFAQSGGIGGILAARDSLRQMMPAERLWPVTDNTTWSFHTVTQGFEYFDAVMKAMEQGYGAPEDFDDFCNKLYAMNYNSARGMFEAYARHKYDALGITTWKYNAAWPAALTWQYVDWYKRATAAYYGAKKACTPVHLLYAPEDQALYAINSYHHPASGLTAAWSLHSLDGTPIHSGKQLVDIEPDGKTRVTRMEVPDDASDPYFLKISLHAEDGGLLSDNCYWLSRTPDVPGSSGHDRQGVFYTRPKSRADFRALATLPQVILETSASVSGKGEDVVLSVQFSNPAPHVAFLAEAALVDERTGREAAPVYWSDNYLVLFPEEQRTLTATVPRAAWGPSMTLRCRGFNIDQTAVPVDD